MEDREKKHIFKNLSDLVDNTVWNTACISVPFETGVFGEDDIAILEAIPIERQRILRFYRHIVTKHKSYEHLITALLKGSQSGAAKLLCELDEKYSSLFEQWSTSSTSSGTDNNATKFLKRDRGTSGHKNSIRFNVYNPVRLFTGRTKELADLHTKLHQGKTKRAVISQMASIVGLGGIGKTELAKRYIQQYVEKYDGNVVWISAETEKSLTDSFRRLAVDYLKISSKNVDGEEKHIESLLQEVYNFFKDKPCLFVFDNAESNEELKKFMPLQVATPPYVLITSRDRDWKFSVEMLELHEMEELEAIEFVKTGLQIEDDSQDDIIQQLVKTLQYFPLALSQAISYILQQQILYKYDIGRYLEEFKACTEKLLNFELKSSELNTYTKTTFTTWKMTTDAISKVEECGTEAIRMLNMISYFEPDKIPTKILIGDIGELKRIPDMQTVKNFAAIMLNPFLSRFIATFNQQISFSLSPEKNEKALHLLVKYSMVNVKPTDDAISIHRLVQEVTRIELRARKLEETTLEDALRLLSGNQDIASIRNFCRVYKFSETYKKLVVDFKYATHQIIQVLAADTTDYHLGALEFGTELVSILLPHVSSDDVDLTKLQGTVAQQNFQLGKYKQAVDIFKRILPTYLENRCREFLITETLDIQHFLARSLNGLGRANESLIQLLQTYNTMKACPGLKEDWWTIEILVSIAEGLQQFGYFNMVPNEEFHQELPPDISVPAPQEIIQKLLEAFSKHKQLIDTDQDGNYANLFYGIADFFFSIGQYQIATTIASYVYEKGKHSTVKKVQIYAMHSLSLLGGMKKISDCRKEAHAIFEQAYLFGVTILGKNHIHTLISQIAMLRELSALGKAETAIVGLRKVSSTLKEKYPDLPEVFSAELGIGEALYGMKKQAESLELLLKLRKNIEQRFGQNHELFIEINQVIGELHGN